MTTFKSRSALAMLSAVMLLSGAAATRRGRTSSAEPHGHIGASDDAGPAWQESKNTWTKGTDLLDWSRDPRRVDPKVYRADPRNSCGSGNKWSYALVGQLEGQEWHFGLVEGKLEPKSKAQLISCQGFRPKIIYDSPGPNVTQYLAENDILLERDMPMEKCRASHCPKRGSKCATYRAENGPGLNGPISSNMRERVEQLLRDYGPMAVYVGAPYRLGKDGFLNADYCDDVGSYPEDNFLLVGYGRTDDGVGYFKFKSARGPAWGHDGYGYFKYTEHDRHCGHLYGKIDLWKIKPCRGARAGRRKGRSRL